MSVRSLPPPAVSRLVIDVVLLVLRPHGLPSLPSAPRRCLRGLNRRADVYRRFLEIAAADRSPAGDIVESRVTVFTSDQLAETRLFLIVLLRTTRRTRFAVSSIREQKRPR